MAAEITVVVPYYNEQETIQYTLEQIGSQSLAPKAAIFVNSSSSDDSSQVVDRWIAENQHSYTTRFNNVCEQTDNPASSKNVGIRMAKTEWLALMDCGQLFEKNWLKSQWNFAMEHRLDLVSGFVCLSGVNWVDRCTVAQTYGYRRSRLCVPATLMRKCVFDQTGLFTENRRAGYDAAWQSKIRKLAIKRGANDKVMLRYVGINYSDNLRHLVAKTFLYSRYSVGLKCYPTPYYHLAALFVLILMGVNSPSLLFPGILPGYLLVRGVVLPLVKSRNLTLLKEHPLEAVFGLQLIGFLIDISKTAGYFRGLWPHRATGRTKSESLISR
jgi:glycosyltransferase involved in cell wall biosynthesis